MAMRTIRSSRGRRSDIRHRVFSLLLIAGVALVLPGCTGPKIRTASSPELAEYKINTMVVMPFVTLATPQVVRADGHEVQVSVGVVHSDAALGPPPASRRRPRPTAVVPPAAGMTVARMFSGKLRGRRPGILVRSPTEAQGALDQLEPDVGALSFEDAGRMVAHRLKADAALVGLLRVYQERVGSRFGAEPAVVGFEVKLIAADGRVLWVGDYYEAQRPMTQDLPGLLERGIGFFTAAELAGYGAERLIGEFPLGK